MKQSRMTILAAAAIALATGAGAQEVPERIRKAGKIVVATMPNYPPITYKDPATNKLIGFDVELGEEELAARHKAWRQPEPRYSNGVFAKYAAVVRSASEGATTS